MTDKPLVSIIIPVYNVAQYLNECVDSALSQTYDPIEILLIDDGSNDGSALICDEYAANNISVKVYHKNNNGLSSARNYGIDKAKGNYYFFLDSDDVIKSNCIETLVNTALKIDCDMVVCRFSYYEGGKTIIAPDYNPIKKEVIDNVTFLNKLNEKHGWFFVVSWNKLYKAGIFKTIRFLEGHVHEDEYIVHRIAIETHKIATITESLYLYRKRANSISNSNINIHDKTECYFDRFKFLLPHNKEIAYVWLNNYLEQCISFKNFFSKKDKRHFFRNIFLKTPLSRIGVRIRIKTIKYFF